MDGYWWTGLAPISVLRYDVDKGPVLQSGILSLPNLISQIKRESLKLLISFTVTSVWNTGETGDINALIVLRRKQLLNGHLFVGSFSLFLPLSQEQGNTLPLILY